MRSTRCVFSTATALHRVFIAPIELPQLCLTPRCLPPSRSIVTRTAPKQLVSPVQRRCYIVTGTAPAPTNRRLPRDDEIQAWSVTLVDEGGKLTDPRSTYDVLHSMNRETQTLVTVQAGEPGVPPICKIMDKKTLRESEKAKAKAARHSGPKEKTIEMNWAIDGNDLGHRLGKMREFLAKGNKVEIVLAKKKKGRLATEEEARELLKRIKMAVGEVEGSRESKPQEGKLLGPVKLFFEGKAQK